MRQVIQEGTARRADTKGYNVFGKTGTAYKNKKGHYEKERARLTLFVGGFPYTSPRYMILFMLDEPKPTNNTAGFATAGWNAAPYSGKIIDRIAPLLGIPFEEDVPLPSVSAHIIQSAKTYASVSAFLKKSLG
jgi:cell division protein FtsI (penicillin-binding protein 3)